MQLKLDTVLDWKWQGTPVMMHNEDKKKNSYTIIT